MEQATETASEQPNTLGRNLFQQTWWQAASGGPRLEEVRVEWDGKVVGTLCFVPQRLFGLRVLKLPPYTRTQSPNLFLPPATPARHTRNLRRVIEGLIQALPRHDRFHLFLDPRDATAFHFWLAGCDIEQSFTFRLPSSIDLEEHWRQLDQKTRNLIKTAGRYLAVRESVDIEVFINLSLGERDLASNHHDFPALRRLAEASVARNQSCILTAIDPSGAIVAASMLVWDQDVLFYWQSARDINRSPPGANNLLVWRAIEFANSRGLCFDFDGCYSRNAARFCMKFGIPQVVRPSISHMTSLGSVAKTIASTLGRRPTV